MATKIIGVRKETFEFLKQLKLKDEMVDDVIMRLIRQQSEVQLYLGLASEENLLLPKAEEKHQSLETTICVQK
jgi:predicted CopG family antitoxin